MNPFKYLIMIPFGWVLRQLYVLTGNYGLSLILFSLVVKLILLPLSMKGKKSMMKMSRMAPKLKALERKYGADKAKYQTAVMNLYREEGVSASGGCLWSFIPILILFPLYYVIREPLTYLMGLSAEQIQTVVEVLSQQGVSINTSNYYYQITAASHIHEHFAELNAALGGGLLDMQFDFLGMNISAIPDWKIWTLQDATSIGLFLIPIVSGGFNYFTTWVTQKMNNSVATDENGERDESASAMASQMKTMLVIMPLVSVWIGFQMPAGISIYWIAQAVFGLLQEVILTKRYRKVFDAEDAIKAERAAERAAEEAERERLRAERRAKLPEGALDPNTSKKKLKQKQQQKPAEANAEKEEKPALSGDAERPYCRGRSYKPNRYGRNTMLPRDGEQAMDDFDESEAIDDESLEQTQQWDAAQEPSDDGEDS